MTAEIQDPRTGQWYPYTPQNDNGRGNVRIDGQVYSHDAGLDLYRSQPAAPAAPAAPAPAAPVAPLHPGDPGFNPNVNTPTTWDPGANAPSDVFAGWHWDPGMARYMEGDAVAPGGGGGGGDTGGGGGGGGAPAPPSYPQVAPGPGALDPWSGFFAPSADASADIGGAPIFTAPEWQAPRWTPPPDFVAPKGTEVYDDPGYQFRADEGQKRLEAGAAAHGLLRSGGTLKDLLGYGQSLASQEYGNVYDRRASEYRQKYDTSKDAFQANYGAARDEYDRLFGAKSADYSSQNAAWQSALNNKNTAYDRDWKAYLQSWDEFNSDRNFKLRALGG